MASTDAKIIPQKNEAYRLTFALRDVNDDLVSGATGLDSEVSLDAGAFADCTNEAVEIAPSSGLYYLDLTAAEMNADTVAVQVKSNEAKTYTAVLMPREAGDLEVTVEALAVAARDDIADGVWDEILTGATHNIATSAGRRLRTLSAPGVRTGTAQGGGLGYITLDAGASALNGAYDPAVLSIEAGTGAGQSRLILDYDGTTKRAYVDRDWRVTPDATSEFVILASVGREHVNEGKAQGGASHSITLNTLAAATDDTYNGQIVFIRAGTGADQARRILQYDGATKVAIVDHAWAAAPDASSIYVVLPTSLFNSYEFQRIQDMIEHQRGHHTVQGQTYYVDPVNGDDANPGTRTLPRATVQSVHDDLVTDSAHDLIVLLAGQAGGVTTLVEAVALTKRYVQIRGPGRDFVWTRAGDGPTITLSADGIGLLGFTLRTAAVGTGAGARINAGADFCGLEKLWIEDTQGHGVHVTDAVNTRIKDCQIEDVGQSGAGCGIRLEVLGGNVEHTIVENTHIGNAANDGICTSGSIIKTLITSVSVHDSGGYGLNFGTGHTETMVNEAYLGNNTSGDVNDPDGSIVTPNQYLLSQLSAAHGAGSWVGSVGGEGSDLVTVTIEDTEGNPISGARVDLYDTTNTVFIARHWTDVNGQIVYGLDPETYSLRIFASGFAFTVPETLVVAGDASETFQGQSFLKPLTPESPTNCIIFGAVVDGAGNPIAGLSVEAYAATPQDDGTYIIGPLIVSTITDVRGYFELSLLRNITVSFQITGASVSVIRTVPNAPWQWYTTWAAS